MTELDIESVYDFINAIDGQSKRLVACRDTLRQIEAAILEMVPDPFEDPLWLSKCSDKELLDSLLGTRCWILNEMFKIHCTKEEVQQFSKVNDRLYDMTKKMYARSSELYRQQLSAPKNEKFDDDMFIESVLHLAVEDKEDVLNLPDDSFYRSDFAIMNSIITTFEQEENGLPDIEHLIVNYSPDHSAEMADYQLGIFDDLDDGLSWQEGCLCVEALNGICMCHATHDVCTHKNYSIPDFLRLNCFWIDVKMTYQHITNLDGKRRIF